MYQLNVLSVGGGVFCSRQHILVLKPLNRLIASNSQNNVTASAFVVHLQFGWILARKLLG